jgi:ATPase subunit of ABC transporter with duplicated ATPase domains
VAAYQALLADLHSGPQNMAKALKRLGEKSRFSLAKMMALPPEMRVLPSKNEGFTIQK